MNAEQARIQMVEEMMEQSKALSTLLFDRDEDGSFKAEHWVKAVEVDALKMSDATKLREIDLLILFTARIAFLMSGCDKEHLFFMESPAMILGHIAGQMLQAEATSILHEMFQRKVDARNN